LTRHIRFQFGFTILHADGIVTRNTQCDADLTTTKRNNAEIMKPC
jgi:hypothetical protein